MTLLTRPDGSRPEDFHLSRRGLVGATFFSGYAVAALAADAEPIHTDEQGLKTETVMIPSPDRPLPAYLARPDAPGRHPAVIVASEIFGVHDYIKDICRRLAKLGYVAIAPAFFIRTADPAPLSDMGAIMKIVAAASDKQVMGDVGAAIKFLQGAPYADAGHMAITGFCWGGKVVWNACETFPELKAGAAWYGHMAPAKDSLPDLSRIWPLEHVADLKAPVLGLYGGLDKGIPTEEIQAMRKALEVNHKQGSLMIVYPDAQHGFHADYRASYNAADAKDAWDRMLAHFKKNGVG
ncbi:dienelactone hydrolase family protein [Phenylobacterium montanum]|uniref:Dienelactone hydrolase family protein n=1 Tax=Phenylobacterium montanum TaxID=2823693 RepID=A0A975ITH2_9CAUL|nr:dienelactone hydrolase family protein [Caulobacter sp. S6]QUD86459.1 dienelactone hydrolase family protein [Caulobacter sp. S6]